MLVVGWEVELRDIREWTKWEKWKFDILANLPSDDPSRVATLTC